MPQRILLFTTDLLTGGTPTVVRELAVRLRDRQTHTEVACLSTWGPVADQLTAAGVRVSSLNARHGWNLLRSVHQLRQLLIDRQIDTIMSFLVHANFVATLAVRTLEQIRLIQSIQTTQAKPSWHWWLQGRIQLAAQTIVVPSQAIISAAQARSNIAADRFTMIPNAIDPSAFTRAKTFAHRPIRVGFLGRLDPVKRLDVAIEAIKNRSNMTLEIFGEGAAGTALRRKYPNLANITWHGAVASPQHALSRIDALILPSVGEGFGLVLIEAMAAGIPIVASAAGAIPEIVTDGQTGLLVPIGDNEPQRFAEALDRLCDEPHLRNRLIDNSLQLVNERYVWSVVLPQYRDMLHA